ncbi:ricin-type beta-trefoil lectin domain protein [Micromonospora krabiensis]|uniref:Ricin-type beta-trefoil lectin domain-containing protein n=1 Tax=Micromonospora krabiensis TaxID=307121 RepID=A0A1C3MXK2_9ACTN|nr:RICIN domain-containing protein [Micromonospora krabiensis]SBV25057.1 Ricin-type beta-trefoil lectin domain-containing protein [Micromonospora krabiensis]
MPHTSGTEGGPKLRRLFDDLPGTVGRRSTTTAEESGGEARRGLGRLNTPLRRSVAVGLPLVLTAVVGVVAATRFTGFSPEDVARSGRPAPASELPTIAAAARSCPVLTPARLAAQLMAASAFSPTADAEGGGRGIAGLTDTVWDTWKPGPAARRDDPSANIVALAHHMCDLSGQVRQAGVGGERWALSLAAYHSGLASVRDAHGVPDQAKTYVTTVVDFAAWYARQPEFLPVSPSPATPDDTTTDDPANEDPALLAAGEGPPATRPTAAGQPTRVAPARTPTPPSAGRVTPPAVGGAAAPPTTRAPVAPPQQARTNTPSPRPPQTTSTAQPSGSARAIIGHESGKCLDVTDGAYTSNPQLQIWTCNGGPNQQWTPYSDGTLRAFGRCMTVASGSTADGAKILLSACNGGASQLIGLNKAHDIVNRKADKCVDVKDMQTGNGTRLQLWTCAGTDNQKWSWR